MIYSLAQSATKPRTITRTDVEFWILPMYEHTSHRFVLFSMRFLMTLLSQRIPKRLDMIVTYSLHGQDQYTGPE